ncbi:MAG: DNA polymerase III subunit delta', partial [Gammaproteobacteria bacterium]|nr:DNA polymerase III subunit delta' [Gammaproteobacteria bacterium]
MSGGLPDIDGIPLPWQTDAWQQLCESLTNGKLPHALLLSGVAGTGKQLFAHAFARLALCQQPKADRACASCPACHQFLAGAHPDYFAVGVLQERTTIMVEQIRALSASLALTS